MPLVQTRGAASAQGFGEFAQTGAVNYIEDVFSCFLYTGNGSTQTITNGIDLSTKGGLTWIKNRVTATTSNIITDTVRGKDNGLVTNSTGAQNTVASGMGFGVTNCFLTNGFTLRNSSDFTAVGENFVSWTFRKQPKFFDVVTYTGTGSTPLTVSHNLGSVPGCIIVKAFSSSPAVGQNWIVYHRSIANLGRLNSTDSFIYGGIGNVTSTSFEPSGTGSGYNVSGVQYVAYLFAHDAGGFGLAGTDNVISCGSYTGNGLANGPEINLGYEPQWLLVKNATGGSGNPWNLVDNMRGWQADGIVQNLHANDAFAESQQGPALALNATGFRVVSNDSDWNGTSETYIYIAIRRGPMKVPTLGTSVFLPSVQTGVNTIAGQFITTGFPPDLSIEASSGVSTGTKWTLDRLRGNSQFLATDNTVAESSIPPYGITYTISNVGVQNVNYGTSTISYVDWLFRRAPSFFDEVCYTGTGVDPTTFSHNLTVIPELLIIKRRSGVSSWPVFYNFVGSTFDKLQGLNQTGAAATVQTYTGGAGLGGAPTATTFTTDNTSTINGSGGSFVAYLFATCAGVSKVGSFTGNGSTQTINCGFTTGARFVLIKRTDSNGDWYVYDTARGMTSGTAPYTSLNNSGGSTATAGSVTTVSTGFALDAAVLAAINTNAASYIFLAIA